MLTALAGIKAMSVPITISRTTTKAVGAQKSHESLATHLKMRRSGFLGTGLLERPL